MTVSLAVDRPAHECCADVRARLSDYLEQGLDPHASEAVVRHLVGCPDCGRILVGLVRTIGALSALGDLPVRATQSRRRKRSRGGL
jgi:hypothetical protein